MNNEEKKSKVAICERCQSYVLACHLDYLTDKTEKEFTDFTNLGFTVKIETLGETKNRNYSWWEDCKNGLCKQLEKQIAMNSKMSSIAGLALLSTIPTFGWGNDMRARPNPPLKTYSSNKPNKRRAKVKAGRKANLKNRKK